jgi:hypothetical protein
VTFDTATLELLRTTKEVRIRTSGNKGRPVTIWIVVVDDAAFVRSVRGPTGQWFVAATADRRAMLDVGDRQLAVRVIPVTDHGTIEAISNAYERPGQRQSISAAAAVNARGGFWYCAYQGGLNAEFVSLLRRMMRRRGARRACRAQDHTGEDLCRIHEGHADTAFASRLCA